jgi:type VI secretion system protein ImpK
VAAGLALFVGYRVFDKPAPAVVAIEAVAPTVEASKVEASKVEAPKVEAPAAAQVLAPHRMLEQSLADELNGGLVALSEDSGRSVIVLRNPRQFSSGGVEPSPEARAALEKLGAALERVPGTILIRGYSDGIPVHTGHFASNRELSAARAQAAGTALAAKLSDPRRIASEGAGEADPIAPNDTEPNLAKNRRVVIILGPKP